MKTILILGAGKSATVLIEFLLSQAPQFSWKVQVADANLSAAKLKIGTSMWGEGVKLDVTEDASRRELIGQADLVISLLPPHLHILVARDCLLLGRSLFTASYIDEEVKQLAAEIEKKGLLFLYEMGLDPGIDHMSAMALVDEIKSKGGNILSFISHCGGLVATDSDNNPWHYKISWNPSNVVQAGKNGALYRWNSKTVQLNTEELFAEIRPATIQHAESLAWYPNRNSLSYLELYGLDNITTFIRTTLRHPNFIKGWHRLVQLGFTQDNPIIVSRNTTYADLVQQFLAVNKFQIDFNQMIENDDELAQLFQSLGFMDTDSIAQKNQYSPATFLQECLEKNLKMEEVDKDRVVMQHEIIYELNGQKRQLVSTLDIEGADAIHTAMAKTVGLPLALAAVSFLKGELQMKGLKVPIHSTIYKAILPKLKALGIHFHESEIVLKN
ncbi:MAG: saccharopine dehydrogenase [Chitinophagaceae bacterium]|nr:saccharopine dehydrogenase [Chitinophagaceae bacterium]